MKFYTKADFEAEFEPKNLKVTALKMLAGAGFAAVIYASEGWKIYLTPLIVVLLYYAGRIILALINARRR